LWDEDTKFIDDALKELLAMHEIDTLKLLEPSLAARAERSH